MIRGLCSAFLALVLSLLVGAYVGRDQIHKLPQRWQEKLYLVVPEPDGLAEALKKEPVPKLGPEDLRKLEEDGVILMRGVLKQPDTIEKLRRRLWAHIEMPFEDHFLNHKSWLYNGACRALLRDGSFGDIIGQVWRDREIRITEAPIWGYPARGQATWNGWHTDSRVPEHAMLSIWLVLTDGPVALQFVRGSGRPEVREDIENVCAKPVPGAKLGFKQHDDKCVLDYAASMGKNSSSQEPILFGPDLKAGDAFLFNGNALHRGVRQTYPRVALSLRAIMPNSFGPGCHYQAPLIFPRSTASEGDFDCSPWALLPGLPEISPWLPAGSIAKSVLRLLERF